MSFIFDIVSFALGAVTAVSSSAVYAWVKSKVAVVESAAKTEVAAVEKKV